MNRGSLFASVFALPLFSQLKLPNFENDEAFCRRLKEWAEDYVGVVGENTNFAWADTGEPYVAYGFGCRPPYKNFYSGVEARFKNLIRFLCEVEKARHTQGAECGPLRLHWRFEPYIEQTDKEKQFYMRLLISKARSIPDWSPPNVTYSNTVKYKLSPKWSECIS